MITVGRVRQLVVYPVKSMAGIPVESAFLGWHGLGGDRRFAFRRPADQSAMPFLSASRLPQLILYHPIGLDETVDEPRPTHVRTPEGAELELASAQLAEDISRRLGSGVELIRYKRGIFDEGTVSIISLATIAGIGREVGVDLDSRRFRANILLETGRTDVFLEDEWTGRTLTFGEGDQQPAVTVTLRDERCMMVNLDPDTAAQDPRVMKAAVRMNQNNAGVYGTVVRTGRIRVGDGVYIG